VSFQNVHFLQFFYKFTWVFFAYSICIFPSFSQQKSVNTFEAIAHYTFEIIKQVDWPNEGDFSVFTIGILGEDRELQAAFTAKFSTPIRGKTFKFETIQFEDVTSKPFSIIFIINKNLYQNSRVFAETKRALIVTEGRVNKSEQMISLIMTPRNIEMALNRQNLIERNFVVSTNLLEFAGTKEDLSQQIKEDEQRLQNLLSEVAEKEEDLLSLVAEKEKNLLIIAEKMKQRTTSLHQAQQELKENTQTLAKSKKLLLKLSEDITQSEQAVQDNKHSITEQQNQLIQKQTELRAKEQAIATLQSSINANQRTLDEQVNEMQKQQELISRKDQTISLQKDWLIGNLIVLAIFFIMIYALLRLNKLRRQAHLSLKQLNSQLYEQATTDGMTGLFNRRHFLETTQIELIHQQRKDLQSAILMIDIDLFKNINDTYGHAAGDEVIKAVANMLKVNSRPYDVIGRLGGEEFAILLLDCDIETANNISQRLCNDCANAEIFYKDASINVSISIGLSPIKMGDKTVEQILNRADRGLYQAKQNGRNQVVEYDKPLRN
jgi:diguanylate cyclase (GGDEF)-like protein